MATFQGGDGGLLELLAHYRALRQINLLGKLIYKANRCRFLFNVKIIRLTDPPH